MDVVELHRRTVTEFADRVAMVTDEQWDLHSPCPDWSVRDLVNHVVAEDRWSVPLLEGHTIAEVGSDLDGDLLGAHGREATRAATIEALELVGQVVPTGGKVHLSYGDEDVDEYVRQLAADHLLHAWDLAVATGGDTDLDPELVDEVATWFEGREELYRSAGLIDARAPMPVTPRTLAEEHLHRLLAASGRDPLWGPNHDLLARFADAWGRCDIDDIMSMVAEDCVFEATGPPPDGTRIEGAPDLRAAWGEMFASTTDPRFSTEELFVDGNRGVLRWLYSWTGDDGAPGHIRGVDVLRFEEGKVAEKLSYVKG